MLVLEAADDVTQGATKGVKKKKKERKKNVIYMNFFQNSGIVHAGKDMRWWFF